MKKQILNGKTTLKGDLIDAISQKMNISTERIEEIPIEKIKIKSNIRKEYKDGDIEEMAKTIKEKGLLQPITVVKSDDGFYEIIFGHRRYKGMVFLNKSEPDNYLKVKCIVKEKKDFDQDEITEIQLIENIQREDLTASEMKEALLYFKQKGLAYKEIAEKIGKSEGYVKNLFMSINILNENKELNELVKSHAGVTLADLQEIKVLPFKFQVELIKEKIKGGIKNREELREKVWKIKEELNKENANYHLKKKSFDILKIKQDESISVRSFSFNPKKTTEEEKKKLLGILRELISRIQEETA